MTLEAAMRREIPFKTRATVLDTTGRVRWLCLDEGMPLVPRPYRKRGQVAPQSTINGVAPLAFFHVDCSCSTTCEITYLLGSRKLLQSKPVLQALQWERRAPGGRPARVRREPGLVLLLLGGRLAWG